VLNYGYSGAGDLTTYVDRVGNISTFSYDNTHLLTNIVDPRGVQAVKNVYDASGRLTDTIDADGHDVHYDADDRVSTDSYDANGNTILNSGQTNVYDFENRLVQRGGVKIVYDGDGNRVKETVATVTTSYLVADQNPTGYAQVLDEIQAGAVTRTYSYGLELINEQQTLAGTLTTSFYGYDGHGSVRFLTDSTGANTDTYDYDAFGNLISSTGSTPNNYLFAGEQFDPALSTYYNRARYYDQRRGRFWVMDTFEGDGATTAMGHTVSGHVITPADFNGLVCVGLFSTPIPQSKPLACAVAAEDGEFVLCDVPAGRWFLFGLGLQVPILPHERFYQETALRGGGQVVDVSATEVCGDTDLFLRPALPTDPPILLFLPDLIRRVGEKDSLGLMFSCGGEKSKDSPQINTD
jgi:RHS repeat-associated protein